VVQSVVRDGQLFYKRPAAVDYYDRHHQSRNGIIIFILKVGSPSHLRRQATGQATRGQKRQSRMSTHREEWRVDTK
jgi:hypothetical protein